MEVPERAVIGLGTATALGTLATCWAGRAMPVDRVRPEGVGRRRASDGLFGIFQNKSDRLSSGFQNRIREEQRSVIVLPMVLPAGRSTQKRSPLLASR